MTATRATILGSRPPALGPRLARTAALAAATLAAAAVCRPALAAGDPQADYVALFGAEEKRVLATPGTKDDAAFAAKLVAKAAELKDDPALQRYMYERAVTLGQRDPDGVDAAVEAAKRLSAASAGPADAGGTDAERAAWKAKLLELYQAQYKRATGAKRAEAGTALSAALEAEARGLAAKGKHADAVRRMREAQAIAAAVRSPRADELADAAKALQARQQSAERLDKLRAKLDAQGGDLPTLEQVILGYALEADDVPTALKLAAGHPDKAWEAAIGLTAKPPESLSEDDLLGLAEFYRKAAEKVPADRAAAADKASQSLRLAAGEQAFGLYDRYLRHHDKRDAARAKTQQDADALLGVLDGLPGGRRTTVVIWNMHNGPDHNAGSTEINVILAKDGKVVWRQDRVAMEVPPNRDTFVSFDVDRAFDTVRVEVTKWYQTAGGLGEVQVFRHKVNIAAGRPVTASGSNSPPWGPDKLTDGNTSSALWGRGYWMLPINTPGWAEVSLKP